MRRELKFIAPMMIGILVMCAASASSSAPPDDRQQIPEGIYFPAHMQTAAEMKKALARKLITTIEPPPYNEIGKDEAVHIGRPEVRTMFAGFGPRAPRFPTTQLLCMDHGRLRIRLHDANTCDEVESDDEDVTLHFVFKTSPSRLECLECESNALPRKW